MNKISKWTPGRQQWHDAPVETRPSPRPTSAKADLTECASYFRLSAKYRRVTLVAAKMSGNEDYKSAQSIYDFTAKSIKGEDVPLSKYKGHVCLIVNVASKCGLTATNYKELNELYDEYAESKGLRILAFPCNQFSGQEPGTSEDICNFADRQKVKFDLFEKIDVNGDNAHPLWKYLKKEQSGTFGSFIKWNFTKFIVDKNGKVVERHSPNVDPSKLKGHLEKYF